MGCLPSVLWKDGPGPGEYCSWWHRKPWRDQWEQKESCILIRVLQPLAKAISISTLRWNWVGMDFNHRCSPRLPGVEKSQFALRTLLRNWRLEPRHWFLKPLEIHFLFLESGLKGAPFRTARTTLSLGKVFSQLLRQPCIISKARMGKDPKRNGLVSSL